MLGVSSNSGGWCLSWVRETEPVSQLQLAGGHFCQISLGQVCASPVSTCCGKKPFILHFLGQKAGKESAAASLPRRLEESRGDDRVRGEEGGSPLPAP